MGASSALPTYVETDKRGIIVRGMFLKSSKIENDIKHNAKVKLMPDGMCRVTCFTRGAYSEKGYEVATYWENAKQKQASFCGELPKEKVRSEPSEAGRAKYKADALKRAKDKIFDISACNKWDYMVTFTLDKEKVDRYDPKEVGAKFNKWLQNMVQRRGLKALIVPELHKDGAIHFHGLINESLKLEHSGTYKIMGRKKPVKLSTLKRRKLTPGDENVRDVYKVSDFHLGFSTAIKLDGNVTSVAFYMTKYATKDLEKIFGSYYFAVGGVKRELPFIICDLDFNQLAECGKVFKLPENLGSVCYATITVDDLATSRLIIENIKILRDLGLYDEIKCR
ncbi:MAG: hypothetical protein IKJ50_04515 [Clostridia bacterium]|nr:hypothetical protein [Clostridia bacterium]